MKERIYQFIELILLRCLKILDSRLRKEIDLIDQKYQFAENLLKEEYTQLEIAFKNLELELEILEENKASIDSQKQVIEELLEFSRLKKENLSKRKDNLNERQKAILELKTRKLKKTNGS